MANNRFLLRIGGYVAAAVLLAVGAGVGGTAGAVLLAGGLVLVAALLVTFRLR